MVSLRRHFVPNPVQVNYCNRRRRKRRRPLSIHTWYDGNGNRTKSTSPTSATQTASTTETGNELFSDGTYTYTYDNNGNCLTKTLISSGTTYGFTWDYDNRLIQVATYPSHALAEQGNTSNASQVITYTYDAYGRRIRETVTVGATTTYDYLVYDDNSGAEPFMEFTATNGLANTPAPTATDIYLNAAAVDQVLADDQLAANSDRYGQTPGTAAGTLWLLPDQDGTPRDLMWSSNGKCLLSHRVYNSFGVLENVQPTTYPVTYGTTIGYAGMFMDASAMNATNPSLGLQLLSDWNRWYDPAIGRFISPDPAGTAGSGTNLYAYCGNGPMDNTDPNGECPVGSQLQEYSPGPAVLGGGNNALGLSPLSLAQSTSINLGPTLGSPMGPSLPGGTIGCSGPTWSLGPMPDSVPHVITQDVQPDAPATSQSVSNTAQLESGSSLTNYLIGPQWQPDPFVNSNDTTAGGSSGTSGYGVSLDAGHGYGTYAFTPSRPKTATSTSSTGSSYWGAFVGSLASQAWDTITTLAQGGYYLATSSDARSAFGDAWQTTRVQPLANRLYNISKNYGYTDAQIADENSWALVGPTLGELFVVDAAAEAWDQRDISTGQDLSDTARYQQGLNAGSQFLGLAAFGTSITAQAVPSLGSVMYPRIPTTTVYNLNEEWQPTPGGQSLGYSPVSPPADGGIYNLNEGWQPTAGPQSLGYSPVAPPADGTVYNLAPSAPYISDPVLEEFEEPSEVAAGGEWTAPAGWRLPTNNGQWSGTPGNSFWKSNIPEVNQMTGNRAIGFNQGYIDLSPFKVTDYTFVNLNGTSADFALADEQLAIDLQMNSTNAARVWRSQNQLTWHHVQDGRTLELVPTVLNDIPHVGGASIIRGR